MHTYVHTLIYVPKYADMCPQRNIRILFQTEEEILRISTSCTYSHTMGTPLYGVLAMRAERETQGAFIDLREVSMHARSTRVKPDQVDVDILVYVHVYLYTCIHACVYHVYAIPASWREVVGSV